MEGCDHNYLNTEWKYSDTIACRGGQNKIWKVWIQIQIEQYFWWSGNLGFWFTWWTRVSIVLVLILSLRQLLWIHWRENWERPNPSREFAVVNLKISCFSERIEIVNCQTSKFRQFVNQLSSHIYRFSLNTYQSFTECVEFFITFFSLIVSLSTSSYDPPSAHLPQFCGRFFGITLIWFDCSFGLLKSESWIL